MGRRCLYRLDFDDEHCSRRLIDSARWRSGNLLPCARNFYRAAIERSASGVIPSAKTETLNKARTSPGSVISSRYSSANRRHCLRYFATTVGEYYIRLVRRTSATLAFETAASTRFTVATTIVGWW